MINPPPKKKETIVREFDEKRDDLSKLISNLRIDLKAKEKDVD